ncbi:MAG: 4-hydroxy-tetrahydrodipicolinate reductase [Candidatus Accumulibacter sp.]|uniref:4-hydroxy-tetrahydrodipicolinate reductase n=1 Tax=Accumulibacter sp. TaxID=2053492 RepID=UPI00287A4646|nr:4-hydroxy-tetrahydrodipicolinate reductase [Accumulibacter sp.]MDS4013286.1 4-hydroxy-tetrahydrodipicolinate reductase [Accumulibacter sp.]
MHGLRIAVAGAGGRMGQMLIEATLRDAQARLVGAFDCADSPALGRNAGEMVGLPSSVVVDSDAEAAISRASCLIDFTRPEGTLQHLEFCRRHGVAIVIGTTGFDGAGKKAISRAASDIPIVFAPNMSVGVNVVLRLLETAAHILHDGYDVEIVEAHHRHKVDAPSGTALRMGEVIAQALARDLGQCAVYARQGVTGERSPTSIGFATVRGGDIVGDHNVMFCGLGERVEIGHKASSRLPYALGSLRAARFLADRTAGLFDMQDVLGLR